MIVSSLWERPCPSHSSLRCRWTWSFCHKTRCEPAVHAAAVRVLNAARKQRACPLHVRSGCEGGREGGGGAPSQRRRRRCDVRGSEVPNPPSAHSRRRMTVVFPASQGPRQTELLETRKSVRAQRAKVKRCVFVSASRHATTSGLFSRCVYRSVRFVVSTLPYARHSLSSV